jgi:hypothetical protein
MPAITGWSQEDTGRKCRFVVEDGRPCLPECPESAIYSNAGSLPSSPRQYREIDANDYPPPAHDGAQLRLPAGHAGSGVAGSASLVKTFVEPAT